MIMQMMMMLFLIINDNNCAAMAKEPMIGGTGEAQRKRMSEKLSLKTSKPTRHTGDHGDGDYDDEYYEAGDCDGDPPCT